MPNNLPSYVHIPEVNCRPWSGVVSFGTTKRDTQSFSSARAQESAVASVIGIASRHRVNQSTIVNRYGVPGDGGSGPTISTCIWSKRRFVVASYCNGAETWR